MKNQGPPLVNFPNFFPSLFYIRPEYVLILMEFLKIMLTKLAKTDKNAYICRRQSAIGDEKDKTSFCCNPHGDIHIMREQITTG